MSQASAAPSGQRPQNLALFFQEVITATVRLRSNRQAVSDAESFRTHIREGLRTAMQEAQSVAGYATDDIRLATFAAVAFLDESILNAQNPLFANWPRKPLQEELFGTHMAGEVFFQNLQGLLGRNDSPDLADLLEVYYLCLLLGYRGRFSKGTGGDLAGIIQATGDKIRRIRGPHGPLSPAWALPPEEVREAKDPWTRRFVIGALVCFLLAVVLFVVYKVSLNSGSYQIREIASQVRS